jgi:hypothetical protein
VHEIYSAQLRCSQRRWLASKYDAEIFGDRVMLPAPGGAQINVYSPAKPGHAPGEGARVIDGQARRVIGADEEPTS